MTSEATDESGVNAFMLALAPGIGRARRRFAPKPSDANEPNDIGQLKPGRRTAIESFQDESVYYSFTMPPAQRVSLPSATFWRSVCGKHHRQTAPILLGQRVTAAAIVIPEQRFLNANRRY